MRVDGLPAPRTVAGGTALIALGAVCVQLAATIAVGAFHRLAPSAVSGWRFVPGAVVLVVLVRPRVWRMDRRAWAGALALGVSTALMNLCFFQAIRRIPLGSAVAIEYLGPFLVALLGQRSARQATGAVLAAGGVVALTHPGSGITLAGAGFAGLAAVGWATYTFASHRVGASTRGFEGLALAMVVASAISVGFSIGSLGAIGSDPALLARLVAMSLLAVVVGFGAELQALRRLRPTTVAVLLALDPAVAFLVAWIALGQSVNALDALGVALVGVAGILVARGVGAAPGLDVPPAV